MPEAAFRPAIAFDIERRRFEPEPQSTRKRCARPSVPDAPHDWVADDDDQVMEGVKAGNALAFGVLYDRYCDRAYRVARSVCGNDHGRAQEVVQEAFISIWKTRHGYDARRAVAPWVLTITRNRAIDILRRSRPHAIHRASEEHLDAVPSPASVAEQVIADDQATQLHAALAQIPDAQREAIALAFYGELTHNEIAAHLDLPLGTVKSRIRLGMQGLRSELARTVLLSTRN